MELTVSMSTAVPTTRSLWTRSAKVWMHFQLMPESWRIASLLHQTCLIEQVSLYKVAQETGTECLKSRGAASCSFVFLLCFGSALNTDLFGWLFRKEQLTLISLIFFACCGKEAVSVLLSSSRSPLNECAFLQQCLN